MKEPVLVIMAAGMGSRYGGLKQIDPIDEDGNIIMDYSIYDAKKAGFKKVLFIIKEEISEAFRETIGNRIAKQMEVSYVFQSIDQLPEGYDVPIERKKPWGTGHAVLCCKKVLHEPFAVINADDYYGKQAFRFLYDFLKDSSNEKSYKYMMVGYYLKNTVTENGAVARGICEINDRSELVSVTERTHIVKRGDEIVYSIDGGKSFCAVDGDHIVSMNMWGFTESFLEELDKMFPEYLGKIMKENPEKGEYFLPAIVNELLHEKKAVVKVKNSPDKWYGVTYRNDKEAVMKAVQELKESNYYNGRLWEA